MSSHSAKLVPVQKVALIFNIILITSLSWFIRADMEATRILPASEEANANEYPAFLTIECAFATEHDRVYVYAEGNDMAWRGDLTSTVDFEDDVWIFDRGADGSAQLIIRFSSENDKATAMLYDDQDGDGEVAFHLRQGTVEITESKHWRVKVQSSNSSWLQHGVVNPNLSFWIDGTILRYLNWGEASPGREWALENVMTDGGADWRVEVVDGDEEGITDYQLQRLQAEFPEDMPVFRSTLYANESGNTPISYANYVFWPLLVSRHNYEAYNYFDHPPAISMAWELGKIDRVGILGYPVEQGYHINSRSGVWQKNRVNYADFENPMAYYDLAEDEDGQAELFIRLEVYAPQDRFFMDGKFPEAMTSVEYAWDQNDDGLWDYQLSLGGRHAVTSEVSWPDFSLLTVPYEDIPNWVTAQKWDAALWVAAENGGHRNSEGMSIWNVNRGFRDGVTVEPSGLRNGYLTGAKDHPPIEDYNEIQVGFRGEWSFEHQRRPHLYLSPVDGKLHLAHAAGGVWSLLDGGVLRYSNLDGDAYIDRWEYWQDEKLNEALTLKDGYLIYSGEGEVVIKEIDRGSRVFAAPPEDRNGWLALGESIDAYRHDLPAQDFRGMMARFSGTENSILGAEAGKVQFGADGFGFVLALEPGFKVEGEDLLGLKGLNYGDYWVDYAGKFELAAAIPARLEIMPVHKDESLGAMRVGERLTLVFRLINTGHQDAVGLMPLAKFSRLDGGRALSWKGEAAIAVPAGGSVEVEVPWVPEESGAWQMGIEMMGRKVEEGVVVDAIYEGSVWVTEAERAAVEETTGAFGLVMPGTVWALLAALMAVGAVAGCVCWRSIVRVEDRQDRE